MSGVTETLAGRVAILDILGFSRSEMEGRSNEIGSFLPTEDWIKNAKNHKPIPKTISDIYSDIWKGSYPKMVLDQNMSRNIFYKSYIQTYIERDVREITKIDNVVSFHKFLLAVAARTGQLLNYADLSRDADIDQTTAKNWISILETSGPYICFIHIITTSQKE
jgi:predicted AAA+ superfamily ATPase